MISSKKQRQVRAKRRKRRIRVEVGLTRAVEVGIEQTVFTYNPCSSTMKLMLPLILCLTLIHFESRLIHCDTLSKQYSTASEPQVTSELVKERRLRSDISAGDSSSNSSANEMLEGSEVHFGSTFNQVHQISGPFGELLVSSRREIRSSGLEHLKQMNTVRALLGHTLTLACSNLTISNALRQQQRLRLNQARGTNSKFVQQQHHQVALIVWHKDDQLDSPIFSVDARGVDSLRDAKQAAGVDSLRGRSHLELTEAGTTPALVIEETRPEDEGVYTCTLEFNKAPTQTHVTSVQLISPAKNMIIRDETNNQQLAPGLIGPYDEDSRLTLTCEVDSDRAPHAQIGWWQLQSVLSTPTPQASRYPSATPTGQQQQHQTNFSFPRAPLDLLTTQTLIASQPMMQADATLSFGGKLSSQAGGSLEYFVGFQSGTSAQRAPASGDLTNPLPFSDSSASLKRWLRVQDQMIVAGGADNKPQATIQVALTRTNLADEYLCLANNNDFFPPLNGSVKINLNLKPTDVRIVNKQNIAFKLGQKVSVECQVLGSKPAAKVTWLRASQQIDQSTETPPMSNLPSIKNPANGSQLGDPHNYISEFNSDTSSTNDRKNRNSTKQVSYLTLIPQLSDNQQSLTCLAQNPKMSNSQPQSDSIVMNVLFAPRLKLQFGASIKLESVRLGSDVFFECIIEANPQIDDLTWLFNNQPLTTNVSAGVIISNQSLVLQKIRVEHRGHYECVAHNFMGSSQSNKLELKPKFAPICDQMNTRSRYEVSLNQAVKIECNILAEPDDDINFVWHFNQTDPSELSSPVRSSSGGEEMIDMSVTPSVFGGLSGSRLREVKEIVTNFTKSQVIFTPKSRRQYGQFLCRASNAYGMQEEACVINVVPSESPDPVFGCFFDGFTNSSFSVHCQAPQSASGGRQSYLLELYKSSSGEVESSRKQKGGGNSRAHVKQRQESEEASGSEEDENEERDSDSNGGEANTELEEAEQEATGATNQQPGGHNEQHQQHLEPASTTAERQQQLSQLEQAKRQKQSQVKRLTSDTPSFQVTDLRPDTSYSVMIYVQNSRGRSAPVLHQRSTLPQDGNSLDSSLANQAWHQTANGGDEHQIEFSSNQRKQQQQHQQQDTSLFDRLISHLKLADFFSSPSPSSSPSNNNNMKPLVVGVVLIIMLCVLSIIVVSFFVSRFCGFRAARSNESGGSQIGGGEISVSGRRKIRRLNGSAVTAAGDTLDASKLMIYGSQRAGPKLDTSVQLTPAKPTNMNNSNNNNNRLMTLAGSGSDTSRETNTDSTLISSSRGFTLKQTKEFNSGNLNSSIDRRQLACNRIHRTSYSTSTSPAIQQQQQLHHQFPISMVAHSHFAGQNQQSAGSCHYSKPSIQPAISDNNNIGAQLDLEQSTNNTPQLSIQSGGGKDCDEHELPVDVSEMFHQEQLLIKCEPNNLVAARDAANEHMNEPVYLIHRHPHAFHSPADQQNHEQIRLLNPISGLWTYNVPSDESNYAHSQMGAGAGGCGAGSVSTGCTQASSSATADSFERTPTGHNDSLTFSSSNNNNLTLGQLSSQEPMPINLLSNSMSIPVSLSDCVHSLDHRDHHHHHHHHHQGGFTRRMSQDHFFSNKLCVNTSHPNESAASYLTLTPDNQQIPCQRASVDYGDHTSGVPRSVLSTISQPVSFFAPEQQYLEGTSSQRDDQFTDQQHYCAHTLDESYRQARRRIGSGSGASFDQVDSVQSPFNGYKPTKGELELPGRPPAQRLHVKFDQQFIDDNTIVYNHK